ncbi:MAG: chemotaxis protein CheX [Desulfovibrio sp.]
MDMEMAKAVIKAAQDVLSTMAGVAAEPGKPYVKKGQVAKGDVTGIIGITGDMTGSISISFEKACAIAVVRSMLGAELGDILRDVQDAVGEITNMVSGQARAAIDKQGLNLRSGTPTVVMGDNHTIQHITDAPIMAIPFSTPDGSFTVEFCVE